MKRYLLFPALALGLCAVAPPAQAANVINFDDLACSPSCALEDDYGDTDMVDVSYGGFNKDTGKPVAGVVWGGEYGDLRKVLMAGTDGTNFIGELTLRAREGYQISLLGFDFGNYYDRSALLPLKVTSLDGSDLFASGSFDSGGSGHGSLAVNTGFVDGVVVQWGPDSYNMGIDNIRYDTKVLTAAVPEPASWLMMIVGFGLVGGVLRSSRRRELTFSAA